LGSIAVQPALQPSPPEVLPSSQASISSTVLLPQRPQGWPGIGHDQPASSWQLALQPSLEPVSPSSHCSLLSLMPLPHCSHAARPRRRCIRPPAYGSRCCSRRAGAVAVVARLRRLLDAVATLQHGCPSVGQREPVLGLDPLAVVAAAVGAHPIAVIAGLTGLDSPVATHGADGKLARDGGCRSRRLHAGRSGYSRPWRPRCRRRNPRSAPACRCHKRAQAWRGWGKPSRFRAGRSRCSRRHPAGCGRRSPRSSP